MRLRFPIKKGYLALFMIMPVVFIHCGADLAGSEVANEKIVVYMPGGQRRAANAYIEIVPVDNIPGKQSVKIYSDSTNGSGEYILSGIPEGFYNILASKDTFVSLLDSVYIKNSGVTHNDTLQLPGSFTGYVKIQPNDKPEAVIVQLIGTAYCTNVDSSGKFTIKNVADGAYQIRLEITEFEGYTPTFRTIRIRSGFHDTLHEPISLVYFGIPVITNLKASFNAQSNVITVNWEPVNYDDFYDYAVYRDFADTIKVSELPVSYVKEPVFYDTIKSVTTGSTTIIQNMYRVAVRNNSLQQGKTFKFVKSTALIGDKKGLLFPSDTLYIKSGVPCSLSIVPDSILGKINSYYFAIGTGSQFIKTSGPDTSILLTIAGDSITSNFECVAKVITGDDIELTDTLYLQSQLSWKKTGESPVVNSLHNYAVSFKGSLFLFTSRSGATDTIWSSWSSADGNTWTKVSDTLPFRLQKKVLLFKDKLWVFERRNGTKPLIWFSDNGLVWSSQIIDSIPGDFYSTEYEVWSVWGDRLVLVNYYPLCLADNSCNDQIVTSWESFTGFDWHTLNLNKSVFPDRYDKPNANFNACELNGNLMIGGGWRALGLKNPAWTAYSFRIWKTSSDEPVQLNYPVPVDTNASFNKLTAEAVVMKGRLYLSSSVDTNYMWVLMEKDRWVRCSDTFAGSRFGDITCLLHNGTLFSISNAGVWSISK